MQRNNYSGFTSGYARAIDPAVVRQVMQQVYLWMALAMFTTALTALLTVNAGLTDTLVANPLLYIVAVLAELGLVVYLGSQLNRMAPGQAMTLFFAYSALNGVTLSLILLAYTTGSVVSAFVSAGAMFGAMSIVGATTNVDLSKMGSLLVMALFGLIIAMIVNMFLGNPAIDFVISVAGVIIFTGLTAWDTQRISHLAGEVGMAGNQDNITRVSILGALILYLDFINLFLFILRMVGKRR